MIGVVKGIIVCAISGVLFNTCLKTSSQEIARGGNSTDTSSTISFYPYQQGWLGADSAYSIPLSPGRSVWLFGDTFIGPPNATDRNGTYGMPRNSIGIANCAGKTPCSVKHFWSGMGTTAPRAYFDTQTTQWYWPLDGFVSHGTLYIFFERMQSQGSGAFGFGFSGVVLVSVPNPADSPEHWRVHYQNVLDGNAVIPGVAAVAAQGPGNNPFPADPKGADYAYLFTSSKDRHDSSSLALTRIAFSHLTNASLAAGGWEYLTAAGKWQAWKDASALPVDAARMIDGNYTELTVKYHPSAGRWLMVMPSKTFMDPHATYSLSKSMTGPWSQPRNLYSYPEMERANSNYTRDVFCYAAKEHPELERNDTILFTYACNSMKLPEVMSNPKLYYPIPISVKISLQ